MNITELIKSVYASGLTKDITVDSKICVLLVNFGKNAKKCTFQFRKSMGFGTYFCQKMTMPLYLLVFIAYTRNAGLTGFDLAIHIKSFFYLVRT